MAMETGIVLSVQSAKKQGLDLFDGLVNGVPACILVDSGATHSLITEMKARECAVSIVSAPTALKTVAQGELRSAGSTRAVVEFDAGQGLFRSIQEFLVTPELCDFDVILGRDWLRLQEPQVDWTQGTFRPTKAQTVAPQKQPSAQPPPPAVNTVKIKPDIEVVGKKKFARLM